MSSHTKHEKLETNKITDVKSKAVVGSVNACEVVSFQNGERKRTFFASDVAAKYLLSHNVNLSIGITALDAQNIGKELVSEFDKAIENIHGEPLVQSNPLNTLLFGTFIVHYVPTQKHFELITINVYRSEATQRTAIERSTVDMAIPEGASVGVLKFAQQHPRSLVANSLRAPAPCRNWTPLKSLQTGVEMIQIAHRAEPNSVGATFDAILLSRKGKSSWICNNASNVKQCKWKN